MKDKEPSSILIFGLLTVVSGEGFGSFHAFLQSLKVKITFDMVSVKQVVYFIYIHIKHFCKLSFTDPAFKILLYKIMFGTLSYICLSMDSLSRCCSCARLFRMFSIDGGISMVMLISILLFYFLHISNDLLLLKYSDNRSAAGGVLHSF